MKSQISVTSTQPCARCGARLDTTGHAADTWLSCPSCGQPVQVRPEPIPRPRRSPEEPPSTAWADDPRLVAPPAKPIPDPLGEWLPLRRIERRAGFLHILTLAGLAGVGHAMFAGTFLMVLNPKDLAMCWAFGTLTALFVAIMVNTMRWGGREERRGPP